MKRRATILGIAALFAALAATAARAAPGELAPVKGIVATDFIATDLEGKRQRFAAQRGKVVLLNFWASWCGVCKTEKPSLAEMSKELGSDDFEVISLASDRSWGAVLTASIAALNEHATLPQADADGNYDMNDVLAKYRAALPKGVPFKVFLDPPEGDDTIGKIAASWGIKAVPESALIDRKGNIRAYFVNKRDWETPVAKTCLRSIIDEE